MRPVDLPEPTHPSWKKHVVAETQQDIYLPLPTIQNPSAPECPIISCWELTDEEARFVAQSMLDGTPFRIYLTCWTFRDPLQPLQLSVMPPTEPYPCPMEKPQEPESHDC